MSMCAQVLTVEDLPEGKNKAIIHSNAGYVDHAHRCAMTSEISEDCFEVLQFLLFHQLSEPIRQLESDAPRLCSYILVKREDALYAIQANCTSCRFPLIEGKVGQP